MSKKQRKFADDGWAIWVDGEDTSAVYIHDWLNPKKASPAKIARCKEMLGILLVRVDNLTF